MFQVSNIVIRKSYILYKVFPSRLRETKLIDTDNSMVMARGKGGEGEVGEGKWGINLPLSDGRRFDLGWWTHNTIHRWGIVELYTWNLYKFINQWNSNKKKQSVPLNISSSHLAPYMVIILSLYFLCCTLYPCDSFCKYQSVLRTVLIWSPQKNNLLVWKRGESQDFAGLESRSSS